METPVDIWVALEHELFLQVGTVLSAKPTSTAELDRKAVVFENESMGKQVVIFCGAGFSAFAGLPLMGSFADKLRSTDYLKDSRRVDFDAIQLRCDSMCAFIGGNARNLEHLASLLSVMSWVKPHFLFEGCHHYKKPKEALGLVLDCIRHLISPMVPGGVAELRFERLRPVIQNNHMTFITTNYDLLIEFMCMSKNIPIEVTSHIAASMHGARMRERSLYNNDGGWPMKLLKLHGSSNWLADGDDKLHVFPEVVTPNCPHYPGKDWDFNVVPADFKGTPLLVPPSVLKPELSTHLEEQWTESAEAIANADALWFIGYSFPETDSFMRYFLASSLATNARLRQIVVIDPSKAACKRAKDIFRLPSLEQVFRPLPVPWEMVKYQSLLNGAPDVECVEPAAIQHNEVVGRFDNALSLNRKST